MDFITNKGDAPLHPFQAFPYERFEGNASVGREKSMEYCLRLIDTSDEFYLFGISEGTLDETLYAIEIKKPIIPHLEFDPEWIKFYARLKQEYGNPLDKLLFP